VLDEDRVRNLGFSFDREYPHQLVLDGRVAGSWRRQITAASTTILVKPYNRLTRRQLRALTAQVQACGRFFGRPCQLAL
jgi:hypothetical protein